MTYGKASLVDKRPFKPGDIVDMIVQTRPGDPSTACTWRLFTLSPGEWNGIVLGYKYTFWVLTPGTPDYKYNSKMDFYITKDTLKICTVISSCT